jgi:stearoyl-CoA 9-desaturase NADPH oxidoreductase
VEQVQRITRQATTLTIRPGVGWRGHRPGQFVTVGVDVDGVRHHRCYSLTSTPTGRRGRIEICVQAIPGGTVSNHLAHRARAGDVVQLSPADGDFTLPSHVPDRLLFITGGSGITPVISMLRWLASERAATDVTVLHHAPDPGHCLFLEELRSLDRTQPGITVRTTFTRDGDGGTRDSGRAGRLDPDTLQSACPDWDQRSTYACGPESLLDFVTGHWEQHGRGDLLHLERFTPPRLDALAGPAETSIARFACSDADLLADPATPLLDIAERGGLTPPSGCRMGICHTCSTRLDDGQVRDLRDGRMRGPGEHVQLCVSAAVGNVTLDA